MANTDDERNPLGLQSKTATRLCDFILHPLKDDKYVSKFNVSL